jgi:hypothetical protein
MNFAHQLWVKKSENRKDISQFLLKFDEIGFSHLQKYVKHYRKNKFIILGNFMTFQELPRKRKRYFKKIETFHSNQKI